MKKTELKHVSCLFKVLQMRGE